MFNEKIRHHYVLMDFNIYQFYIPVQVETEINVYMMYKSTQRYHLTLSTKKT